MASAALVVGMGVSGALLTAAPASAVPLGTVEARVADHVGNVDANGNGTGTTTGYCIRYTPPNSNTGPTNWVTSPSEAITAHGYKDNCPTNLSTSTQSAIGVTPVAGNLDPAPGASFNIGRIVHYNNPINYTDDGTDYFRGEVSYRLSGQEFDYSWWLWETPNTGTPTQNRDQVKFLTQASDTIINSGGIDYKLIMLGFYTVDSTTTTCPATPPAGSVVNQWYTNESAKTVACLYGQLSQVRNLTVEKVVTGTGAPNQSFTFAPTSSLAGSPWTSNFNLSAGGTKTGSAVQGETITIAENAVADAQWNLAGLKCVDGTNTPLGAFAQYDAATRKITLTNIPAAATAAAAPIKCTFTNHYTTKAKLTLKKVVASGSASNTLWTLTGNTGGGTAELSGPTGISKDNLEAGSYTLGESGGPAGYAQQGDWVCTNDGSGTPVSVTGGNTLNLVDKAAVTCTVTNRYQTGSLEIKKVITDASGFSGNASTPFAGTWQCGAMSGSWTATTATPYVVNNIPAGTSCTVTETGPSGSLKNGSYVWKAYTTDGPKTVPDQGTATITVTNSTQQNIGTFTVAKTVEPENASTPDSGYAGGTDRQFTVHYVCTLAGQTVSEGDLTVTTGTPVTGPDVPSTSSCAITEPGFGTPGFLKAGDFADASYEWSSHQVLPNTVVIPVGKDTTVDSTVTNRFVRNFTSLEVTKVVDGAGYTGTGKDFSFTVAGCLPAGGDPYTVAEGETVTIGNIPVGTLCYVQEVTPITAPIDAAHEWGLPTYAPADAQVTMVKGETAEVTITNHTVPIFGQVSVTKALGGEGGVNADKTFDMTITCGALVYTQSIKGGETYTTPAGQIPAGTECTVSEGAVSGGLANESYAWLATPVTNDQKVTVTKNGTANVTMTNTTKRVYGSLTVAKTLVDPDGVYDGPGFSGTYSCTDGSSGSWGPLAGGASIVVDDSVLLGSQCDVTETAPGQPDSNDASYVWSGVTYTPGAQVTLSAAAPNPSVTVTNTIVRQSGAFTIAKTVSGDAAGFDPAKKFSFDWSCTPESGPELSGTIEVAPGGLEGPSETIPAGSDCTVTENADPAPNAGYTWDGVVLTATPGGGAQTGRTVPFTIPAPVNGEPVTVQVSAVNSLSKKFGSVEITKSIDSAGFTGGADFEFEASVNCGANGTFPVTFTTAGSSAQQLPLGSECTVTEVTPSGGLADGSWAWDSYSVSPTSFTITAPGQEVDVTITNTVKRVYGAVTLQKSLTGQTGVVDTDRVYSGTWQCVYGDGSGDNTVSGTWDTEAAASAITLSDHVLVGSDCTVESEDLSTPPSADPSFVWQTPVFTGDSVHADGPALLQVANAFVRQSGKIEVIKHVTGDTEGYIPVADGGLDFPINYDCSVTGVPGHINGTVNVADGAQTVLINGVPFGWTCAISEGALAPETLKDASYSWGAASVSPNSITLSSTHQTQLVEVTNPISQGTGTFTVTKSLSGVPNKVVDPDTDYSGTWSCTYDGEVVGSGDWTITDASGGTTAAFGPVPLTSECSVTEDAPSDADLATGWSWTTPVIGDPVTIGAVVSDVEVTNSVEQLWGSLDLTKVTTGETAGILDGTMVEGGWICRWTDGEGNDASASGRWVIDATGDTISLFTAAEKKVPVGADCGVLEDTLDGVELVDASYAWGTPDNGEIVTLANGQTAGITVTNTVERVTGTVIIDKTVTGPAKGLVDGSMPFSGTLTCTYNGVETEYPWTATPNSNATVTGILATSSCEGVETPPTTGPVPTDPSYQWVAEVGYAGNPATVPSTGSTWPTISVTNDTFRLKGDFTIEKVVSGTPAALEGVIPDSEFTFGYSCVLPEGGDPVTGELTATTTTPAHLPAGVELPAGTECTITEAEAGLPPLADDSYNWGVVGYEVTGATGTPGDRSVTFTIAGDGAESLGHVLVEATNPVTQTPGSYTADKQSTPPSGSTVQPGDTITYVVTVTPDSESVTVHDVVAVDDLTGVVDHAVLDVDSITATKGTFDYDAATKKLTWTVGDLSAADGVQTLEYSITVNADAWDATIGNSVTVSGDTPPEECTTEEPCTTDHHTDPEPAHLTLVKNVDNSAFTGKLKDGQVPGIVSDWNLSAEGELGGFDGPGGSAAIVDQELKPGAYTLDETLLNETNPLLAFYSEGDWSCIGGANPSEGVLTLQPGADVTCTIVNTAETVDLAIDKRHIEGDGEGTWYVPTDEDASYPYQITATNKTPELTVPNVVITDAIPATLKVDTASVEASLPAGWTYSLDGEDAAGFGGTLTFTKTGPWTPEESDSYVFEFDVMTAAELPREDGSATGKILDIVNTAVIESGGVEGTPDDNTSTENTPVKSVKVDGQAICLANAPWVEYDITPYNIEHLDSPEIVLIWWTSEAFAAHDPSIPASDIAAILADGASQVDEIAPPAEAANGVTISGKQLWPGAAVDAAGNATAWPGWTRLPDGRWVIDPAAPFYDLRGSAIVEIRMNPSTDAVAAYPPATPDCNPAPTQPKPPAMASTGFDPSWGIWGAATLLVIGFGLLLVMRRRRAAE